MPTIHALRPFLNVKEAEKFLSFFLYKFKPDLKR